MENQKSEVALVTGLETSISSTALVHYSVILGRTN
jgi:hypothetical protein